VFNLTIRIKVKITYLIPNKQLLQVEHLNENEYQTDTSK